MRYIGDLHGHIKEYQDIIKDCPASVQVGDFGYGFVEIPKLPLTHRFIRGNHDHPRLARESPNYIGDYKYEPDGVFYISGAQSIDKYIRIIGQNWWPSEELDIKQFEEAVALYNLRRPRIVVAHEIPDTVASRLFSIYDRSKLYMISRTRNYLDTMFYMHKPEIWIFGHWHTDLDTVVDGTRFICLNELSWIDL